MARIDELFDEYCASNKIENKYFESNIDNIKSAINKGEIPKKVYKSKVKGTYGLTLISVLTNRNLYLIKENTKRNKFRVIPIESITNIYDSYNGKTLSIELDQKIIKEMAPKKKRNGLLILLGLLFFPFFFFLPFGPLGMSASFFSMMRLTRRMSSPRRSNDQYKKFLFALLIIMAAIIVLMFISNMSKKRSWGNIMAKNNFEFILSSEEIKESKIIFDKVVKREEEERRYEDVVEDYDSESESRVKT